MRLFPEILYEDNSVFLMFVKWVLILNDYSLESCVLGLGYHDMQRQRFVSWINAFKYFFKLVGSQPGNYNNMDL